MSTRHFFRTWLLRGRVAASPWSRLEPWSSGGMNSANLLQDIVAGRYDTNIQWACTDIATYPGQVIVRWGHEMENLTGRYPWATSNSGPTSAAYITWSTSAARSRRTPFTCGLPQVTVT